jgi:predicted nucleic acid-binding protein
MSSGRARRSTTVQRVILDANVLVPNSLRDTLLRAAEEGWYEPYWSATTLIEVERALASRVLRDRPDNLERARRLITALSIAFPAGMVPDDVALADRLTNHPKDRHVLAAAIRCGARTIVTANTRDFPSSALSPHHVTSQTPDRFLQQLFAANPDGMIRLLVAQGANLRPPRTLDMILSTLNQHGHSFVRTVEEYRRKEGPE